MCAAPSPRLCDQQWRIGHTIAADPVSSTTNEQLVAFLKERLDRWEIEAAEVICTWGRVGDMCSSEYQSQLRTAQATVQEGRRGEERQRGEARRDAQAAARRRHRDRLAAEARSRADATLRAAVRQQQRVEQQRRGRESERPPPAAAQVARQLLGVPAQRQERAEPLHTMKTGSARGHRQPVPPCVVRAPAAQTVRKLELEPKCPPSRNSGTRFVAEGTAAKGGDNVSDDSSTLALDSDGHQDTSAHSERNAPDASLGESLSGTFVVRRRLSAHVHYKQALRRSSTHLSPAKAGDSPPRVVSTSALPVASPSPRKVVQWLLPLPHRRCSSSKTTVAGTTNPSLSLIDSSLPVAADEATAIFASRSRSHENAPSPQYRRSGSAYTADATAQFISPIKGTHLIDDLSSMSSAGSYLQGGDGSA
ncbi:hypothetical protein ABB37_04092 [Leptomonas pyrrhocoris]|uniref:Uncharacterized protein n=1 Tax=Leptomonas pyrrhocoris TaxID=157538 RepID=A0A0N0DWI7_LEPPY|nr:hypothetical protein ABB37_04092 [Leptomonas pyrrhocoris]XP_015660270.1 hypothetical protein ABB37_04092 [Leptomonas pyrrhocoris]XP_015660271.1 hypothetical protein ABB37_04092 [Leptomonas pyrrhocoris]KPA81830.1 hypothetical protein ABB37_04092 [Leptomonas pyrrhocoris]KPA81831.1 hypothetical protein ABB37_04092 [Leptomonas pyrrhocoris]KPA81832.1 hypothetical protein ABB37_04092 [Leptomonas pyrrhocoris]|eukprot:XP_015660269.1 hypothetical protein ABB37_04092 [Leptomonas pyrrhocoris]